ncbi:MAG: hypothetical protein DMF88_13040 [Acidobacteria bacterium]|nr:MAG: hypothetical protein DMF88_13040 [Acidobacteriota bacterium]
MCCSEHIRVPAVGVMTLPGIRSFPVGSYLVLYRIDGDDVVVQRIVRGSRDLDALFGEQD